MGLGLWRSSLDKVDGVLVFYAHFRERLFVFEHSASVDEPLPSCRDIELLLDQTLESKHTCALFHRDFRRRGIRALDV